MILCFARAHVYILYTDVCACSALCAHAMYIGAYMCTTHDFVNLHCARILYTLGCAMIKIGL